MLSQVGEADKRKDMFSSYRDISIVLLQPSAAAEYLHVVILGVCICFSWAVRRSLHQDRVPGMVSATKKYIVFHVISKATSKSKGLFFSVVVFTLCFRELQGSLEVYQEFLNEKCSKRQTTRTYFLGRQFVHHYLFSLAIFSHKCVWGGILSVHARQL